MTAPAEHLRATQEQARRLRELEARVDVLNGLLAAEQQRNEDLILQRDMARQTVERQQTEFEQWRLRPAPRPTRRTRDVPTGELT